MDWLVVLRRGHVVCLGLRLVLPVRGLLRGSRVQLSGCVKTTGRSESYRAVLVVSRMDALRPIRSLRLVGFAQRRRL